jgi:hypothetical protein
MLVKVDGEYQLLFLDQQCDRTSCVLTDSGEVVVGRVININADKLMVLTNMLDPSALTTLSRDQVEETRPATTSMMPAGLLDTFTEAEIIQLMAYLRAGGQSDHPLYRRTVANK